MKIPIATTFQGKLLNILAAFSFVIIWYFAYGYTISYLWDLSSIFGVQNRNPSVYFGYFTSLIQAPIVEELIFRYAPLQLVKKTNKVLPMMILSSALFGWLHGGFINVMFQGVFGFAFAWVYVSNNYSYWSAVTIHSMSNMFMILLGFIAK